MEETKNNTSPILPWLLFVAVMVMPFIAWLANRSWSFDGITILAVFPLLGLWAWGLMWTHYAYGSLRIVYPRLLENKLYSQVTGVVVLALILLHPVLLVFNQWKVLAVPPPASIYGYVAPDQKLFVFFGSLALTIFLSFEIFNRLKEHRIVKRYWKWISLSQMLAMVLIFFHALSIGGTLNTGWFELYWVILGALLIPCFGLIGREDWKQQPASESSNS